MSPTPRPRATPDAWVAFYDQHERALTAYARWLTRSPADAEDLVQDTMLKLVRLDNPPRDPLAYAMRTLRHQAIDRARANARTPTLHSLTDPEAIAPDDHADAHALAGAIATLSPIQQDILILRSRAGLTFEQVSAALDIPLGTAASHHARALATLRQRLTPHETTP